ncbi:MAG TPA: Mrp/NBP35 family ATP-binding protein [Gemmatimonadaceae bacterium]|nr:Mrp/NBP35 family ATP-binding protein [Acidimicrobiia bacterium]
MATPLQTRIADALSRIRHPRTGTDVLSADAVRDIATTTSGKVRLTLLLAPGDDPVLARTVRQTLENLDGVTDVTVDVADAVQDKPARKAAGRALPVMDQAPPAQARVPAPTPVAYPNLGRIIAVSSGKGGVGKSTVAANLAVSLAKQGARVGLMDADVYGPNIPRMMGVNEPPIVIDERIVPLDAHGVKVMSIGFLIDREQPAIWRGPIVMKIITQFLRDVAWGELDYLFVDMPPGTGDAQLSLVQATQLAGAIIVTTPQEVAVGDALRGVKMFERVTVPVLGIVENMSWFECPHCGKPSPIFGSGGGERLAQEVGLPLLGQIPLYPRVMESGDSGVPIVVADPESPAGRALSAIAQRIAERVGATAHR